MCLGLFGQSTCSTTRGTLLEDSLLFTTLPTFTMCLGIFGRTAFTMPRVVLNAHDVATLLSLALIDLLVSGFALPDTTVFDRRPELSSNSFTASGLTPEGATATSFRLQEAVVAVELFVNINIRDPGSAASLCGARVGGVLTETTTASDDGALGSSCDDSPCGTISLEEGLSDNTMPACGDTKQGTWESVVDDDWLHEIAAALIELGTSVFELLAASSTTLTAATVVSDTGSKAVTIEASMQVAVTVPSSFSSCMELTRGLSVAHELVAASAEFAESIEGDFCKLCML